MVRRISDGEKLPFTGHLEELRKRLILVIGVMAVFFLSLWGVSEYLLRPFTALMTEGKMVFINPTEAFFVHVKVAFYGALALAVPVILHQTWAFVAPGLVKEERRAVLPFVVIGTLFFAAGAAFCYFLVLPYGIKFLLGYGGDLMSPMLSISAFLGFCLTLMFVFGLVFQLPLVVVFLNGAGLVYHSQLAAFRPFLMVIAFIVSAVITPPDVFTQVVLALPLLVLYEVSLLFVRLFGRKEEFPVFDEPAATEEDKDDGEKTDSGEG